MLASITRTAVPLIVGWLITQAALIGLDLPEGALTDLVTVGVAFVYYTLARLLEERFPAVGRWLLALGVDFGRPLYLPPPR